MSHLVHLVKSNEILQVSHHLMQHSLPGGSQCSTCSKLRWGKDEGLLLDYGNAIFGIATQFRIDEVLKVDVCGGRYNHK